jgi:hypothetical protein
MYGHTLGVSRGRSDFVPHPRAERCWIDGDLIRLGAWPVGGVRPGGRAGAVPWLIDLSVLETAMRSVYGDNFRLGARAPLLQMAANLLAEGDRRNAETFAAKVSFPLPDYAGRFHDACAKHLAWGAAHRPGNAPIDVAAWVERAVTLEQKFDPNQPRVPRGHPEGGQWTDGGSSSGISSDENEGDRLLTADEEATVADLTARARNLRFELGDRSALLTLVGNSEKRPPKKAMKLLYYLSDLITDLVEYAVKHGTAIEKVAWFWVNVQEEFPNIIAFMEPPKRWDQLVATTEYEAFDSQRAFEKKYGSAGAGYEWHHIVEQDSGFSPTEVHNTDNMVRVAKGRHWKITSLMTEKREDLGGISRREWLRGKSYEEHMRVGLELLKEAEVMEND